MARGASIGYGGTDFYFFLRGHRVNTRRKKVVELGTIKRASEGEGGYIF